MQSHDERVATFYRERRGLYWRAGLFAIAAALVGLLLRSLNSVRLFTISQAPSYVPQWVQFYWTALGGAMGAMIVLGGACLVQIRRVGDAARYVPSLARGWTSHSPASEGLPAPVESSPKSS